MRTKNPTLIESNLCDFYRKPFPFMLDWWEWLNCLPWSIIEEANNCPHFIDPEISICEEDYYVKSVNAGGISAILLVAAQNGCFPDPKLIENFRPLGRCGTFRGLDLFSVHYAFPGCESIVVEGAIHWIEMCGLSFEDLVAPSCIRHNQSNSEYFLRLIFGLAPHVISNPRAFLASLKVARVVGREEEFFRVFSGMI